jgi:DNA-binding XRE family transcriptional regulator
MKSVVQSFGEQLREKAGLTQERLAEASDVNVWTIRSYEQGRRESNWKIAIDLARAVGVTVEAFTDCSSREESNPNPISRCRSNRLAVCLDIANPWSKVEA